ncbi:MAG: transcription termination/antitermination protein NusG [Verrucomicrobiales bacterium]|jgi:transcriptional antiterminator NusG|nr:transcription termination/antitermination protein NusG [Verrucomicrobiales bacterium]MDA7643631.1 transcription termination/antitermination protein NusG [Verrucomicrobiales bacterium]MDC0312775.1 transcription termination/antitermination protein NusG [Verrucomicrobiales bacterium]MDF1788530.1 transcription termination/antitermination protein NusG [Verrucomicrobiales bacterium]NCF86246.1 transcription termination/antitermination factor NusG [Verrucomicrobiaceae bacterium]
MAIIPAPQDQWYVVHVLSGQEGKVRDNINRRIASEEMSDCMFEVLVPTEMVSEVKKGKKTSSKRKFFPGYVIVNMHLLEADGSLNDRTWYFIQETTGVINFAGNKTRPMPMRPTEVEQMLAQIKEREEDEKPRITHEVGDTVKVADGPFESQNGMVEEIDHDKGKIMVSVDIFGRKTIVELENWQVETA